MTQATDPAPARSGRRRLLLWATAALVALSLMAAGCGSSTKTVSSTGANGQVTTQTVPNVHFAKTKFLLHSGLALGAIHRYIYKPLRSGALRSGSPGRIRTLLKGAAAAAFAVHELRLAHQDALASSLLRPLANKLDALGSSLGSIIPGLKSGKLDTNAISSSSSAANALSSASGGLGVHIKDIASSAGV